MNRIADAFQNQKAFIAFITVGDPDLATTEKVVEAAVEGGADLIELGIPFSDPTAEGPVIMEADEVALRAGTTTDKVFELTKKLRATVTIPLVYMTYANVVFSYGCERFAAQAQAAGVDGIILPDVPYEERDEFAEVFDRYGIDLISLLAPTLLIAARFTTMSGPTASTSASTSAAFRRSAGWNATSGGSCPRVALSLPTTA